MTIWKAIHGQQLPSVDLNTARVRPLPQGVNPEWQLTKISAGGVPAILGVASIPFGTAVARDDAIAQQIRASVAGANPLPGAFSIFSDPVLIDDGYEVVHVRSLYYGVFEPDPSTDFGQGVPGINHHAMAVLYGDDPHSNLTSVAESLLTRQFLHGAWHLAVPPRMRKLIIGDAFLSRNFTAK